MSIPREHGKRQAVVIIHGMGEQRPMGTLRGFLKGTHNRDDQFYSRPYDRTASSGQPNYDLRRFTTSERTGDQEGEDSYRMRTDFFELYWAHFLDTGNARYTAKWVLKNTFQKPFWRHTKQVGIGIAILQSAFLLSFLILLLGIVLSLLPQVPSSWDVPTLPLQNILIATVLLEIASLGLGLLVSYLLREVLADPPRYIIPSPKHVRARNEIRDEGVRLLREIHEKGCYERVVVVGHSLGSIVGLDMLRLAWEEYRHPDPCESSRNPGEDAELALRFDDIIHNLPERLTSEQMKKWQETQHELWKECRKRGMKWLVTDFITLGSPLAHADWLLFDNREAMEKSFREREYPTCPPDVGRGVFYEGRYKVNKADSRANPDALVPHHAAPFAVTRWSNVYFPTHRWYGDPVGGDVAATFGKGIRDIKVRVKSCKRGSSKQLLLRAHLSYWDQYFDPDWDCPESDTAIIQARERMDRRTGTRVAHVVLRELLDLDYQPDGISDSEKTTGSRESSIASVDQQSVPPVSPLPNQTAASNASGQVATSLVAQSLISGESTPVDTFADAAVAESPDNPLVITPEVNIQEDKPTQTQPDQPAPPV